MKVETQGRRLEGTFETRADGDDRVPVTVSSEYPVERMGYTEILDHSAGAVDMSRAPLPLIEAHNSGPVNIGLVEDLTAAGDRLRGFVRFGASARAQEVLRDVLSGVVRNLSVGYEILEYAVTGDTVRATQWRPHEVSVVGVGADPDAGFYRAKEPINREPSMETDDKDVTLEVTETETRELDNAVDVDIQMVEDQAIKTERERVNEINATAGKFKHSAKVQVAAKSAIARGEGWREFNKRALDLLAAGEATVATELGLTGKEVRRYSLTRALAAQVTAKERGVSMEKSAPYEYRCHLDILEKLPAQRADAVQGILIPFDVQSAGWGTRAPPADTTENASLVATDHLASQFIVGLRQTSAVMAAGATVLNGLVGDVSIPREESVPVEWLNEDEDATDVDYVTSSVTLSPKTVAAAVPITRRLLKQSSPDVDRVVQNNISLSVGQEIDRVTLIGSGIGPIPQGIRGSTGVSTVLIGTGALTWAEAVQFESEVEVASNLHAGASYIIHPTMKGIAKTTSKDAGSGQFIWSDNAVNGYPAFSSTHAGDANGIIFGNYSNALIGFWGVLDVMADPYTKAASGGLVMRVFQDIDVAVRRGEAFSHETLI